MVVDDEKPALEQLSYELSLIPEVKVCGAFTKSSEALAMARNTENTIDCAFLDIEMPGRNGFALAKELISLCKGIDFVFVTAFNEYAVRAFELGAMDYILKPFPGSASR